MKVIDIVREHLVANSFDGLHNTYTDCGCVINDLAPCQEDCTQCAPGYKHMDPRPDHKSEWMIWGQKGVPTLDQWNGVSGGY